MKKINLIESGRKFSEENINELKGFLSKIPHSHLEALKQIERVPVLNNAYADSNPLGIGEEIRLSDSFYSLIPKEREFVFIHEMGHDYFDFKDFYEGNRAVLRFGACRKEDISHLLRVQWMELGWKLNPENWEKVKKEYPADEVNRDKYTYMVKYGNPNHEMGEWKCSTEGKIFRDLSQFGFAYNELYYSPKEEMADAYALFAINKKKFLKFSRTNEIVGKKYNFIERCFEDNSKGQIELER